MSPSQPPARHGGRWARDHAGVIEPADLGPFGVALPQRLPAGGALDLPALLAHAAAAERDHPGLSALWTADAPFAGGFLAPLPLLSAVATVTRRVLLGTAVLLGPLHTPAELAHTAATVDQLAGGRLLLGVGAGDAQVRAAGGAPAARWGGWYTRWVEAATSLLAGQPVDDPASPWHLQGAVVGPRARQQPPTVWLSGHHPGAIERAARASSGWIGSGFATVEAFTADAARFRSAVERAGGDPQRAVVSKRLYVHLPAACAGEDRDIGALAARRGPVGERFRAAVASGSAAECRAAAERVLAGGADHVILDPVVATPEHVAAVLALVDG